MAESSRLAGNKRARDEGESESGESTEDTMTLGDCLTFSDTLVALRMMRAQFPKIEKVSLQPFVLRSQLYSSVRDRTQVDRELESLKKEKALRVFKLNTGQDDHAIMFMDDYLNQMDIAIKRLGMKKEGGNQVFEWFKTYVVGTKLDVGIEHHELCSLLSFGGKVKEEHVSLLINAGLLTRQLIDPNLYWFAIPNIGPMLKGLSQAVLDTLVMVSWRLKLFYRPRVWMRILMSDQFASFFFYACSFKFHRGLMLVNYMSNCSIHTCSRNS